MFLDILESRSFQKGVNIFSLVQEGGVEFQKNKCEVTKTRMTF